MADLILETFRTPKTNSREFQLYSFLHIDKFWCNGGNIKIKGLANKYHKDTC